MFLATGFLQAERSAELLKGQPRVKRKDWLDPDVIWTVTETLNTSWTSGPQFSDNQEARAATAMLFSSYYDQAPQLASAARPCQLHAPLLTATCLTSAHLEVSGYPVCTHPLSLPSEDT